VDPNPLADFESSLERLRWYDDHLVLPGHEWAFDHLRERLDQLKQHHVERLDEVEAVVLAGAQTTWEVTNSVTWRRPFESLEPRARRSALGETSSHLLRLVSLGRLAVKEDEVATWTVLA
jgi:glyoxylase-like metal-dependent hydrolase (beta-lactamase superfamily II)